MQFLNYAVIAALKAFLTSTPIRPTQNFVKNNN